MVIQKVESTIASLASINQELLIFGHINGSEGLMYRLSQRIRVNIVTLEMVIEDLQPKKEVNIIRDNFGLFQYMTIAEKATYDQISGLQHQVIAQ